MDVTTSTRSFGCHQLFFFIQWEAGRHRVALQPRPWLAGGENSQRDGGRRHRDGLLLSLQGLEQVRISMD